MNQSTNLRAAIERKLIDAFQPTALDIADDSHMHAGHLDGRPEVETHFTVTMTAAAFSGLPRVARHRAVHQVLAEELAGPVHALALVLSAPDDA